MFFRSASTDRVATTACAGGRDRGGCRRCRAQDPRGGFSRRRGHKRRSDERGCLDDTYDLLRRLDVQVWRIAPRSGAGTGGRRTRRFHSTRRRTPARGAGPLARGRQAVRRWARSFLNARELPIRPGRRTARLVEPTATTAAPAPEPQSVARWDARAVPGFVDTPLQERMPNLLYEDLSSLWRDSPLRVVADLRKRDLLARNPSARPASCSRTAGWLQGSALSETGDLMAPDPVACAHWKGGYQRRFQQMAAPARRYNTSGGVGSVYLRLQYCLTSCHRAKPTRPTLATARAA